MLLTWRPFYAPDEPTGGGTDPPVTPAGTEPPAAPPEPETPEQLAARLRAEHQRELDTYRNKVGQAEKAQRDAAKALQDKLDAEKPELERLQTTAAKVPALETERDGWKERAEAAEAALTDEVDARRKTLPKEIAELVPDGGPIVQLAWIRKAQPAAEKIKPRVDLPPAGGRDPGHGSGKQEPTEQERKTHERHTAMRF